MPDQQVIETEHHIFTASSSGYHVHRKSMVDPNGAITLIYPTIGEIVDLRDLLNRALPPGEAVMTTVSGSSDQ